MRFHASVVTKIPVMPTCSFGPLGPTNQKISGYDPSLISEYSRMPYRPTLSSVKCFVALNIYCTIGKVNTV